MLDKDYLKKLYLNKSKLSNSQKTLIVSYNCVESWINSNDF